MHVWNVTCCTLVDENTGYKKSPTRMSTNAQRDDRPAEYRWRPLFNAAKFGWCPLVECRAVTLPRSAEQFFSDCRYVPYLRRYSPTKMCDGAQMAIFGDFLRPVFSASRVQHVSDLHLKFALRPHHVCKYGKHPICDFAENRRGKKGRRRANDRMKIQELIRRWDSER